MKWKRKLKVSDYITYGILFYNLTRNIKYIVFIDTSNVGFKIISISPDMWDPVLVTNVLQQKARYYVTSRQQSNIRKKCSPTELERKFKHEKGCRLINNTCNYFYSCTKF